MTLTAAHLSPIIALIAGVACRQRDDLSAAAVQERIYANEERSGPLLQERCERCVDVAFVAGLQDKDLPSNQAGGSLHFSHFCFSRRKVRIREKGDDRGHGNKLV